MRKIIAYILPVMLLLAACKQKDGTGSEGKSVMDLDSVYRDDKNVTIIGSKDTIRLIESMKNFEDNPNISAADIEASKNIPSAEIQYVRPGDTIRLAEPPRKKS